MCCAAVTHVGPLLTLQGAGAYDAAVHCASVSAARRILQQTGSSEGLHLVAADSSTHSRAGSSHTPTEAHGHHTRLPSHAREQRSEQTDIQGRRRFRGVANKLRMAIHDIMGRPGSE